MSHDRDLSDARRRLEMLAGRLRSDVTSVTEQTLTPPTGVRGGELSNAPFHLADSGTEEFLAMMNATLLENELQIASEVQHALHRIADGTYGICEQCGQEITMERLHALPFVCHCIRCATQKETLRVNVNKGRPATPLDTLAPEGEMLEHRRGDYAGAKSSELEQTSDVHAAGTAGGGTAYGGLAGTNIGHGDPSVGDLQEATGSGDHEHRDASDR